MLLKFQIKFMKIIGGSNINARVTEQFYYGIGRLILVCQADSDLQHSSSHQVLIFSSGEYYKVAVNHVIPGHRLVTIAVG